jgi:hypothetical protein
VWEIRKQEREKAEKELLLPQFVLSFSPAFFLIST